MYQPPMFKKMQESPSEKWPKKRPPSFPCLWERQETQETQLPKKTMTLKSNRPGSMKEINSEVLWWRELAGGLGQSLGPMLTWSPLTHAARRGGRAHDTERPTSKSSGIKFTVHFRVSEASVLPDSRSISSCKAFRLT